MKITSAKYRAKFIPEGASAPSEPNAAIVAVIDGITVGVPICQGNREYDEIMRQVEAKELTIEEAD